MEIEKIQFICVFSIFPQIVYIANFEAFHKVDYFIQHKPFIFLRSRKKDQMMLIEKTTPFLKLHLFIHFSTFRAQCHGIKSYKTSFGFWYG